MAFSIKKLVADLNGLRMEHYVCAEDGWLTCPKTVEGRAPNEGRGDDGELHCLCDADRHNAKLDRIIADLQGDPSSYDD